MIDIDLQSRAAKLQPRAVEQVLNVFYPVVYRMAVSLTGRESIGQRVTRQIMRRAISQMPRWVHEGDAQRWFHHHTILATRRAADNPPEAVADVLVKTAGEAASPPYMALIRALRTLPVQQREAIILHDAEQLDARAMAVAMDCSIEAASNHLAMGRRELLTAGGDELNRLLAVMRDAYHRLTPEQSIALPLVRRIVRRVIWPRRIVRLVRLVILLGVLAALAWVVWAYGPILDW